MLEPLPQSSSLALVGARFRPFPTRIMPMLVEGLRLFSAPDRSCSWARIVLDPPGPSRRCRVPSFKSLSHEMPNNSDQFHSSQSLRSAREVRPSLFCNSAPPILAAMVSEISVHTDFGAPQKKGPGFSPPPAGRFSVVSPKTDSPPSDVDVFGPFSREGTVCPSPERPSHPLTAVRGIPRRAPDFLFLVQGSPPFLPAP